MKVKFEFLKKLILVEKIIITVQIPPTGVEFSKLGENLNNSGITNNDKEFSFLLHPTLNYQYKDNFLRRFLNS